MAGTKFTYVIERDSNFPVTLICLWDFGKKSQDFLKSKTFYPFYIYVACKISCVILKQQIEILNLIVTIL